MICVRHRADCLLRPVTLIKSIHRAEVLVFTTGGGLLTIQNKSFPTVNFLFSLRSDLWCIQNTMQFTLILPRVQQLCKARHSVIRKALSDSLGSRALGSPAVPAATGGVKQYLHRADWLSKPSSSQVSRQSAREQHRSPTSLPPVHTSAHSPWNPGCSSCSLACAQVSAGVGDSSLRLKH